MKKRVNLLLIIFLSTVIVFSATTFGYFLFQRNINGNVDIGKVTSVEVIHYYQNNGVNTIINPNEKGYNEEKQTLTCYASRSTIDDTEGYLELSDLYTKIKVNSQISVRVRAKIEDTWIDNRIFYSDGHRFTIYNDVPTVDRFRDTDNIIVSSGPFKYANNWTVGSDGYLYYDLVIKGENELDLIVNGDNLLAYYYIYDRSFVAYRSVMMVEFKVIVEVVQANRAKELWGI